MVPHKARRRWHQISTANCLGNGIILALPTAWGSASSGGMPLVGCPLAPPGVQAIRLAALPSCALIDSAVLKTVDGWPSSSPASVSRAVTDSWRVTRACPTVVGARKLVHWCSLEQGGTSHSQLSTNKNKHSPKARQTLFMGATLYTHPTVTTDSDDAGGEGHAPGQGRFVGPGAALSRPNRVIGH